MNVYLDHAATTPLNQEVLDFMLPWMGTTPYNANSTHQYGRDANVAVEQSREFIASVLNVEPAELIFTSGGTESNNAVIHGVAAQTQKKHFISSCIEHHAVLQPIEDATWNGYTYDFIQPNSLGVVEADLLKKHLRPDTALVSLMHVNNEIGAINPIKDLAEAAHQAGVLFHSDMVQSIGKHQVNLKDLNVDFASVSAHKFYGPKGIGFLYVKRDSPWKAWLLGGSQERKRRGGTLNVAGIVGMAKALEICTQRMDQDMAKYADLRAYLIGKLRTEFDKNLIINGGETDGMPHILNVSFVDQDGKGLDGEMLLFNLDIEGIAVSNGSACTSGAVQGSHVLRGIGLADDVAKSSIRMSFGRSTTKEDLDYVFEKICLCVQRMLNTASA